MKVSSVYCIPFYCKQYVIILYCLLSQKIFKPLISYRILNPHVTITITSYIAPFFIYTFILFFVSSPFYLSHRHMAWLFHYQWLNIYMHTNINILWVYTHIYIPIANARQWRKHWRQHQVLAIYIYSRGRRPNVKQTTGN